jgi:LAO/AO transport system kinase
MADALVVNKADGDNVKKAELTKIQLENALRLFPLGESQWAPPVFTASALYNTNIDVVFQAIKDYIAHTKANGFFAKNRIEQSKKRFRDYLEEELFDLFRSDKEVKASLPLIEEKLLEHKLSAYSAGKKLIDMYLRNACKVINAADNKKG